VGAPHIQGCVHRQQRLKIATPQSRAAAAGRANAVAFGRAFIANPDLVHRFRVGAALNLPDPQTFYTPGPVGYIDYPAPNESTHAAAA